VKFLQQLSLAFYAIRINRYACNRANLDALGFIKVTYALGAFVRIDFVDLLTKVDGLVGALRLTNITVDALIGNIKCHFFKLSI
jgi:hypothetical protein